VVKRPQRPVWLSSERRHVSDIPPVGGPAQLNGHAGGFQTPVNNENGSNEPS
jgi:cell division protease FtsH